MNHYFLFLSKCFLTKDQQTLVFKYIDSIIPSIEQFGLASSVSTPILPFVEMSSTYFAAINPLSQCKNTEWKVMNIASFDENIFIPSQESVQNIDVVQSENIAGQIHELADQLPICGTFKLDTIVTWDFLETILLSEHLEIASAFYRLQWWHASHTTVLTPDSWNLKDHLNLRDWLEILNAKLLNSEMLQNLSPVVWRGCIDLSANFSNNIHCHGFELQLDVNEIDDHLFFEESHNLELQLNESVKNFAMSTTFKVIDECYFSSIPLYLISPVVYRLCVSYPNIWNEDSRRLLDYIGSNYGVALIFRLNVTYSLACSKPNKSFRTNGWRKSVSSNCISHPGEPSFEKYVTLAVTKSSKSSNIVAYLLQSPEDLDVKIVHDILRDSCQSVKNIKYISVQNSPGSQLTFIDSFAFSVFVKILKYVRKYLYEKGEKNLSSVPRGTELCFYAISSLTSKKSTFIGALNSKQKVLPVTVDPSDWIERVLLLVKQIEMTEEKMCNSLNALKDLGSNFFLSNIQQFFEPSGEAKNSASCKVLLPLRILTEQENPDFKSSMVQNKSEVSSSVYNDIYYNNDMYAEEKESIGNQMVNLYVHHETDSICNQKESRQDLSRVISPKKPLSESSNWMSSFRNKLARTQSTMNQKSSFDKKSENESIPNSNFLRAFTKSRKKRSVEIKNIDRNKDISLNPTNRKKLPVRCSPRKKPADDKKNLVQKVSSQNKISNVATKSQELSELLKKKLRVAVATALENNGIELDQPFFKPCGKRLFAICRAFVQDLDLKKGSISQKMQKIADAHVKQVIEYEKQKEIGL